MTTFEVDDLLGQAHPGQVAQACARLGWRVLPLRRDTKRPALPGWPELATTDPDTVRDWFECGGRWSGRLCGVATGRESGVWVLDVDVAGLATLRALEAERGDLPDTFTVRTPSGGRHLYWAYPTDGREVVTRAGTLGPGLDTRGWHGQVVAPGTWRAGGHYRPPDGPAGIATAPRWLEDAAERAAGRAWDPADDGGPALDVDDWVADAGDVAGGLQEDYLFRGLCAMRARAASRDDMLARGREVASAFVTARPGEPWTERDVVEKVDHVRRRYPPGTSLDELAQLAHRIYSGR